MNKLPKNWRLIKLSDLCEVKIGGTPRREVNRYWINGTYPWVSVAELNGNIIIDTREKITDDGVKYSNVKLIPKSTVLLSFKLSVGKVGISGVDLYTNEAIAALIPLNKNVYSKFLYYFVPTIAKQGATKGSLGQGNLNSKRVKDLMIPIPFKNNQPDLDEQIRIASKIDAVNVEIYRGIKITEKCFDLAKKLNKSASKQFFNSTKQRKEFKKVPLSEVLNLVNGRAFKPAEWSKNGLPIIRIQNLNNHTTPFNYCDFEVEKKYYINNNDLLISWSGTPGTSFGAFIWNRGKAVLNQHIFNAVPMSDKLSKEYLALAVKEILDEMIMRAHGGVGLRHITKSELESIELMIPYKDNEPDLLEQNQIVKKFDEIKKQEEIISKKCESQFQNFNHLAMSTLNQAFAGKL